MQLPQTLERALPLAWRSKRRAAREARKRREAEEFSARMRVMGGRPTAKEGLIVGFLGKLMLDGLDQRLQVLLNEWNAHHAQHRADTQAAVKSALDAVRLEAAARHRSETPQVAQTIEMAVREGVAQAARRAHAREQWLAVEALAGRRLAESLLDASSTISKDALPSMLTLHKLVILSDALDSQADPVQAWLAGDPALAARMVCELDAAMAELAGLGMIQAGYDWRADAGKLAARLEAPEPKSTPGQAMH